MKKIIAARPEEEVITIGDAGEKHQVSCFVGLAADGEKYLLIHDGFSRSYHFSQGRYSWDSNRSKQDLLQRTLEDSRCEMFYFDTLHEFAVWAAKKLVIP